MFWTNSSLIKKPVPNSCFPFSLPLKNTTDLLHFMFPFSGHLISWTAVMSIPIFLSCCTAFVEAPGLYQLWTFQVPIFIFLFHCVCRLILFSVRIRGIVAVFVTGFFLTRVSSFIRAWDRHRHLTDYSIHRSDAGAEFF